MEGEKMKDLTFGQYYPSDSVVHHMDARVKILLMILYIAAIFFISSYFGYAVTLIFILAFSLVSKVPITKILKSVKRITVILVITALLNLFFVKTGKVIAHWWIFTITDYGLNYAIMMALRLTFLVIGTTFLTLTTTPTELTDGLESLMTPLKYVKIPVHDIAVIMSIALRFIPTLMEETQKIMNAQKARGATFDTGHLHQRAKALLPVLIPLFVNSFRRADELAFAMDARCYNATEKRTKMKQAKLGVGDLIATVFMCAFFVVILLERYYFPTIGINIDQMIFGGLVL